MLGVGAVCECDCDSFQLFVIRFTKLLSKSLYWALRRALRATLRHHKKKHSETMANAMEIAPNEGMPALPPIPRVAPVVHAPGEGVGQN
jgi:hypothetical protein